jgi:hypothetical protein
MGGGSWGLGQGFCMQDKHTTKCMLQMFAAAGYPAVMPVMMF